MRPCFPTRAPAPNTMPSTYAPTTSPVRHAASLFASERGQTLVEYSLILAFVSIVGLVLSPIGQWVVAGLTQVTSDL